MATKIVEQHEYRLSEEDRRSILEQTPAGRRTLQIERQHAAFMAVHGGAFGDRESNMTPNALCIA